MKTQQARKPETATIPVTVLTGFLGSGKTTLLNHILKAKGAKRIAVIENEFGQIPIDNDLIITAKEELFELKDGCMCCTVRADLIRIMKDLSHRTGEFDHIILETTGLADPTPIAQTFFVEDGIKDRARLDGVVTVVDAKNVMRHIDESRACMDQVAFADTILLNKCDLVTPAALDAVEQRLRAINSIARIQRVTHGQVPVEAILDQGGFDLDRAVQSKPAFLQAEYPFAHASTYALEPGQHDLRVKERYQRPMGVILLERSRSMRDLERDASSALIEGNVETVAPNGAFRAGLAAKLAISRTGAKRFRLNVEKPGPYALFTQGAPADFGITLHAGTKVLEPSEAVDYMAGHAHDQSVASVSLVEAGVVDTAALRAWLDGMLHEHAADVYRLKGILNDGTANRYVIHGVHDLLDAKNDRAWQAGEGRSNQMVFIGRGLDEKALRRALRKCIRSALPMS
jgi:G3E family GTPase